MAQHNALQHLVFFAHLPPARVHLVIRAPISTVQILTLLTANVEQQLVTNTTECTVTCLKIIVKHRLTLHGLLPVPIPTALQSMHKHVPVEVWYVSPSRMAIFITVIKVPAPVDVLLPPTKLIMNVISVPKGNIQMSSS